MPDEPARPETIPVSPAESARGSRSRVLGELPGLLRSLPRLGGADGAAWQEELDAARADLTSIPHEDPWEL